MASIHTACLRDYAEREVQLPGSSHVRLSSNNTPKLRSFRYWDWSLDWEDLTRSPVFDSTYGFGSNGNLSAPKSVAYGHCVTDGPFANKQALYYGGENITHCFSRGFVTNETTKHEIASKISPQFLRHLLDVQTFERFFEVLEYGPHNAIPKTIRGDFFVVTAPYGNYLSCKIENELTQERSLVLPSPRATRPPMVAVATAKCRNSRCETVRQAKG